MARGFYHACAAQTITAAARAVVPQIASLARMSFRRETAAHEKKTMTHDAIESRNKQIIHGALENWIAGTRGVFDLLGPDANGPLSATRPRRARTTAPSSIAVLSDVQPLPPAAKSRCRAGQPKARWQIRHART
jgi:hypothetical protein